MEQLLGGYYRIPIQERNKMLWDLLPDGCRIEQMPAISEHQTPDWRNFFGWLAPIRRPRLFVDPNAPKSLIENIPALSMAEIYAVRAKSPTLYHADRNGFTILMPGTFNEEWLAREVARGGRIVQP